MRGVDGLGRGVGWVASAGGGERARGGEALFQGAGGGGARVRGPGGNGALGGSGRGGGACKGGLVRVGRKSWWREGKGVEGGIGRWGAGGMAWHGIS